MKKVVIVDGNNFFTRMYFVSKKVTNDPLGFIIENICSLKNKYLDYRFVFTFDTCKSERRLREYPEYKGKRKSSLDEHEYESFKETLNNFIEITKASGCTVLEGDGYEADDYIARISQMLKIKHEVVIISTDIDMYQLIDKTVKVFDPFKGFFIDIDNFENIVGVNRKFFLDYKCYIGDDSDNIPGIAGIGPVTAAKLISLYGDYESILKALKDKKEANKNKKKPLTDRESNFIASEALVKRNRNLMDLSICNSDERLRNLIVIKVKRTMVDRSKLSDLLATIGYSHYLKKILTLREV